MLMDKNGRDVGTGDWICDVNGYRVIADECCGMGMLVKVWDIIFDEDGNYDYDSMHDGYLTPAEIRRFERV